MKILKPYFIIESEVDANYIITLLEKAGRTAYKSEDKITEESGKVFLKQIMQRGHLSVIEHYCITVRIICDRGVTHEIVRHRLGSYTQESTRYCNYSKGKFGSELTVIEPCFWTPFDEKYKIWKEAMSYAQSFYTQLIMLGASPQEARSVLPNSLKTEIVITYNIRQWRHFFSLRTALSAHPQMKEIAVPLLAKFRELIPVLFDNI